MEISKVNNIEKFTRYSKSLEILDTNGRPDVAEIFIANCKSGDKTSMIEFVDGLDTRFAREEKWIINVSTQFGCPVKCVFCDAGHKYYGNLTKDQMLAQISYVLARNPGLETKCEKLKVHFARMGEPAFNNAVLDTIEELPSFMNAKALWTCIPTTAPKGREKWFERLIDVKEKHFRGRFQLQFSINTTDMELRRKLMPIKLHEIDWMSEYANKFHQADDRKVVLNFALAKHNKFDPQVVIDTFSPDHCALKLTPLNPTDTGDSNELETILRTDNCSELEEKGAILTNAGFDVIFSIGDGREDEIGSNCGQSVRKERGKTTS